MDRFYIITNKLKDADYSVTRKIKHYIESQGKSCIIAEKDEEGHIPPETIPEGMDCAIVLGGDGTLIRAARDLESRPMPLLGVNMGTLGYLTETELHNYESSLQRLFEDKLVIEKRMMISGTIAGRARDLAMNDIVVTREGNLRIVHFDVYVNGTLLNSYYADGIIVSTPTGTTGYNLSAGGPIVEPTASMIVVTAICPHSLFTSSIVLSAEDIVEIEICEGRYGREETALVTFDGAETFKIGTNERVVISKAEEYTQLVKLSKESFMKIMRNKMKGN